MCSIEGELFVLTRQLVIYLNDEPSECSLIVGKCAKITRLECQYSKTVCRSCTLVLGSTAKFWCHQRDTEANWIMEKTIIRMDAMLTLSSSSINSSMSIVAPYQICRVVDVYASAGRLIICSNVTDTQGNLWLGLLHVLDDSAWTDSHAVGQAFDSGRAGNGCHCQCIAVSFEEPDHRPPIRIHANGVQPIQFQSAEWSDLERWTCLPLQLVCQLYSDLLLEQGQVKSAIQSDYPSNCIVNCL